MKRSAPLKRTPFRARPIAEGKTPARASAKVSTAKCKAPGCGQRFLKLTPWQILCRDSVPCATAWAEAQRAKRQAAAVKKEKAEHREKLADSKKLSHWLKATERVVNHFVLVRDAMQPCISCGTWSTVQWEAGHYLSVGAHPELRFDPANIHKQCHHCNVHRSGNQAAYRIRLVVRIGQAEVERLEGPHTTAKQTREALEALRRQFAADTRAIERRRKLQAETEPA